MTLVPSGVGCARIGRPSRYSRVTAISRRNLSSACATAGTRMIASSRFFMRGSMPSALDADNPSVDEVHLDRRAEAALAAMLDREAHDAIAASDGNAARGDHATVGLVLRGARVVKAGVDPQVVPAELAALDAEVVERRHL